MGKYRFAYWFILITTLIMESSLQILYSYVTKKTLNAIEFQNMQLFRTAVVVCVVIVILKCLFPYLRYFQIRLVRKMVYELKLKLYEKLLNMNMYFFNDTHSADAIKTLNWDANSLKDSWFSHIYWVLGKIVIVVSSIITMYFYNRMLTCISLIISALTAFVSIKINQSIKKYAKKVQKKSTKLSMLLSDIISGFVTLKMNSGTKVVLNYFYEEKQKRGWIHFGQYGMDPLDTKYAQVYKPIYEQDKAVGHAVRATYMYTAMADLAGEDNDEKLYQACKRLWNNIVNQRMYLTGGIGSTTDGEAFSEDYDLPNDMAYAETCASIAMVFFAKRMLNIEPDGIYADIMERELYNGTISGIQLDGKRYFYVNPLEVQPGISGKVFGYRHVLPERPGWYECACCPTNLVRLMTSLSAYAWSEGKDTIYSHLFMGQEADLGKAKIQVESQYPWEGKVVYHIEPKQNEFTVAIHIPGYIKQKEHHLKVTVNGESVCIACALRKGYLYLNQIWKDGDTVEITFDMPVREVFANSKVRDDEGCVALMRGPVVYCFEGVDNDGDVQSLRIPENVVAEAVLCEEGKLAGMMLLNVKGYRIHTSETLYSEERPTKEKETLTAIPYYAWANRGENQMRVWMHGLNEN